MFLVYHWASAKHKGKFSKKCIPLYTIPYIQNIHCLHLYSLQCVDLSRSIINVSENQEEKNRFMRSGRRQGGHEPPLFPLPGHILAFFSFGSHEPPLFPLRYHHIWLFRVKLIFLMVRILRAFKVWFSKLQPRHAINIYLYLYISVLIWNKDDSFKCKMQIFFLQI